MASSMDESSGDDIETRLFPPGSEVPLDICERVITKSKTVSQMLLRHVQLDAETLMALVSRNVISNDNAEMLANDSSKSRNERIFAFLRPAILYSGKKSLDGFYRALLATREGRLGHEELAEAIKKRVDRYLKRVSQRSVPDIGSSQPHSWRRPPEDLEFPSDSDSSEMLHTPYPLVKQSSLPHDVERDNRMMRMSSMLPRQLSADGTYRDRSKSQTAGSTEHIDSDSSLSSSDGDGLPLKSGSGSRGIHHKVHSRHQPNVLSMLTTSEAKHVELFRAEHGQVRKSLIQSLGLNRHLQDNPTDLAKMLSVNDSGTIAGSKPQIADVVDLWIGKVLKDSSLFGLAMGLAHVPGLGRYITCIAQTIGSLTPAELVHFSKALGHSWTMFGLKIGYEEKELKLTGSSKLSKKAFFAEIWLVPKFDMDKVNDLLCELLTAVQQEDALRNFQNRLSRAASSHGLGALDRSTNIVTMSTLHASKGSRSESELTSTTNTDTSDGSKSESEPTSVSMDRDTADPARCEPEVTSTDTDTETETEAEGPRKDSSATVVEQNGNSLGAKLASQSDSGLVSSPSSGSGALSMAASSLPPPCEDPEDSSGTLVDSGEWSSSDESSFAQDFFEEDDSPVGSAVEVYDKSAIFFGPDIVPPLMSKRSEIAGMYKLLKGQPFDQELFEVMLASEPSLVNRLTEDDRSLLFLACELSNAEAVTALLMNGANPNLQDKYGRTCLHLLSVYWNEAIFLALLQNESINVNVATFKTQITPLCVACLTKEVASVKRLLEKGAHPNGAEETIWPPIVVAAREGECGVVKELLAREAAVDKPNAGGYTALHMAAFEDHVQMVELLLDHNCNPNIQATNCATPLSCAVANGHINTAKILLDSGANVNAARAITHEGVLGASEVSALAEAALGGHTDVVTLLLNNKADVYFKSGGYLSVLGYACIGGSADVVRQLMIHGNMKSRPSELTLPLQSAIQYQNFRCAMVLVEEAGGVEALRRANRYDTQLLQDLNTIAALLSSGDAEMMNLGDRVPKAVGRTDDAFQKCRSRALSATVEEVKLAELFDPDESMVYEGLVQHIVERHIILTAELMAGEHNLLAEAERTGDNEVVDFIRQYKANLIQPAELSFRLHSSPPVLSFYCRHVDLVHLQQCARSTDNKIALQYFLEMQRRRDMGHLSGFGLQMSSYGSPLESGLDAFGGLQLSGVQQGLGAGGSQGRTIGHGLHGGRPLGTGPKPPSRQGLVAPSPSHRSPADLSYGSTPVEPKAKGVGTPSPPKVKDALTTAATPPKKESPITALDAAVPIKTSPREGSSKVSSETLAASRTTEPSYPQSSATQSSLNDLEETDVCGVSKDTDKLVGATSRELRPLQPLSDSAIVADSNGQKNHKNRHRAPKQDIFTSEDEMTAPMKCHRKTRNKRRSEKDGNSSDPESLHDGSCWESDSLFSMSTTSQSKETSDSTWRKTDLASDGRVEQRPKPVFQASLETLISVESSSSDVQGPTSEVPLVVSQGCRADLPSAHTPQAYTASLDSTATVAEGHSPVPTSRQNTVELRSSADLLSDHMLPAYTASSDSTATVAELRSPVPLDKTGQQTTEELRSLAGEQHLPLCAPDPSATSKVDLSSDDNSSLLGNSIPQHSSTVVEAAKADVTANRTEENVKIQNVSTGDENATRTGNANEADENVSAALLTSVASGSELHRESLESTPVPHEPEKPKQQCVSMTVASPDSERILIKGIPDEFIDYTRAKDRFLLSKVCSSVKQRWSMLARLLGLQEEDVEDIKSKCDTSEGRGMAVVMEWLKQTKKHTGSESDLRSPTWHQFAICLTLIRREDLVCLMRSRLQPGQPDGKESLSSSMIDITSPHHLYILKHIAMSIAERWGPLAKCLRVNKDSIGRCDAYNDSTSMCFGVLMSWLSDQGKDGTTFEALFVHLRKMDCDHLVGEALLIGAMPSGRLDQPF